MLNSGNRQYTEAEGISAQLFPDRPKEKEPAGHMKWVQFVRRHQISAFLSFWIHESLSRTPKYSRAKFTDLKSNFQTPNIDMEYPVGIYVARSISRSFDIYRDY